MPGIKISDLTSVTPLSTDIVVLDRPAVGAGAPVTGQATLADIQALIGGGGGGGDVFWTSPAADVVETTGSIRMDTNTTAGTYAVAVGTSTSASGNSSFAQGDNTTASGNYSHAEGASTTASGYASHAEGASTTASGYASHAEGESTTASELTSHAEGYSTTASGTDSHAEGTGTTASGDGSHSEGVSTTASGNASHAEGEGTRTGRLGFYRLSGSSDGVDPSNWVYQLASQYSDITAGNFQIGSDIIVSEGGLDQRRYTVAGISYDGTYSYVTASNTYGAPVYQYFDDGVLAGFDFDSGLDLEDETIGGEGAHAEGTGDLQFQNITGYALGSYSHSEGYGTIAFNNYSHSEGESTRALGQSSHAEGTENVASGYGSHAEGYNTIASGTYSHTEGFRVLSLGEASHAEGYFATGSGDFSHAEGDHTEAIGIAAHAEGKNTQAVGDSSHAEGDGSISSGSWSHAEGYYTLALGNNSHAEGFYTTGSGNVSHAEGAFTRAIGDASHTEGFFTVSIGDASHAEGSGSIAFASASHAEGIYTIASGSGQLAAGKYNLRNNDFSLFVIGDGTADDDASRSDILRVNSGSLPGEGRTEITGSLSVSGSASSLEIFGGHRLYPNIITTLPHTASFTDYIIAVSASAGPGVELRPFEYGRTFIVKDVSGSAAADNITVTAEGGERIDGASSYVLSINRGSATFVYFGPTTGWGVI